MYLLTLLLLFTPLVETPDTEGKSLNAFIKQPVSFELTPKGIDENVRGRMRVVLEPISNEYDSTVDTIHYITAKRNEFKIYQDGSRYLAYELQVNNKKIDLTNNIAIGMTLEELKNRFPELNGLKSGASSFKVDHAMAELTMQFKRDKLKSLRILYYIE